MEIQPAPLPSANVASPAPARPSSSEQGIRADSRRPVESSGRDAEPEFTRRDDHRGRSLDIEV